jgi:RNA polymerase-binding protein DksA
MREFHEDEMRQRLMDMRAQLQGDIFERTEGDEAVTPVDPVSDAGGVESYQADDADAMADTERNQAITRNSAELLQQVDAAIGRLESGVYGVCSRCGKTINVRRLEALPYATLCVACQDEIEHGAPASKG